MMDEEIIACGSYQETVTFLCVEPLDASPLAWQRGRLVIGRPVGSSNRWRDLACRSGLSPVGLEHDGVFGHLHDDGLHPGPVLLPDRVLRDGRIEPQAPAVAFAVVEDSFEEALGLAGPAFAPVEGVARTEGLYRGGAGAEGVGDPLVRLARLHPLPNTVHVRLQRYALSGVCHATACSFFEPVLRDAALSGCYTSYCRIIVRYSTIFPGLLAVFESNPSLHRPRYRGHLPGRPRAGRLVPLHPPRGLPPTARLPRLSPQVRRSRAAVRESRRSLHGLDPRASPPRSGRGDRGRERGPRPGRETRKHPPRSRGRRALD